MKHWKRLAMIMAIGVLPFRVGAEEAVKDSAHVPVLKAGEVTSEQRAILPPEVKQEEGALTVSSVEKESTRVHITSPEVVSSSAMVQNRINREIRSYVEKLEKEIVKKNEQNKDTPTDLFIDYGVMDNKNGIFSVIIKSYTYKVNDANGEQKEKGFSFNSTSGKKLHLYDLGNYKMEHVKAGVEALVKMQEEEGLVSEYVIPENLTVSKNFFLYDDRVYLIYDPGVLAPYSYGNVHVDVGPYKTHN